MTSVLVIGSINIDFVVRTDSLPRIGDAAEGAFAAADVVLAQLEVPLVTTAIDEAGLKHVAIVGFDATPDGVAAVKDGQLARCPWRS